MLKSAGLLRLLPDNLPFYPYHNNGRRHSNNVNNTRRRQRRKKKLHERDDEIGLVETIIIDDNDNGGCIPNQQLNQSRIVIGFTLFFFVDATNIQSLNAISKVSYWFRVVFSNRQQGGNERVGTTNDSRVICITNYPSVEDMEEDIIGHEEDTVTICHIHTSSKAIARCPLLTNSGFFHLPFHHDKRQALLHLLGVTRAPSIVVVNNNDGRIVTRYGWEAIDREFDTLTNWVDCNLITCKKHDDDDDGGCEKDSEAVAVGSLSHSSTELRFDSNVVLEWEKGNSGLPLSWHLLSWII